MKKTVLAALLVTAAVLTTACGSGSAASGNVSSNEAVTTIQAQHPEEAAQAATEEPAAVEAATEETAAQAATEAPAAASFPEFEPQGDAPITASYKPFMEYAKEQFDTYDLLIPVPNEVRTVEDENGEVDFYGKFQAYFFDYEDGRLVMKAYGAFPGKMHMVPNEDGFYTVTDYQVAEDGEGYASSLQEMIGDTEDLTVEMFDTDSESDFELLRGTLQFYVMGNGMDISEFVDMDGTVYSIVEE